MGFGSCLQVINNTPYAFTKVSSNQYQMNQWGPFPGTVASGTSSTTYYEFDQSIFVTSSDDGGDVTYKINDTVGNKSFHYHAALGKYPTIDLIGWTAPGYDPSSPTLDIEHDGSSCAGIDTNPTYLIEIGGSGDALTLTRDL